MRILLVEDNPKVASFIQRGLKEEGFSVDLARDGEEGLFLAESAGEFDVLILDLLLPKKSGLEMLRALRAKKNDTPVLILTAKDELKDKITGLNAGADDYLTKPFSFEELLARVRALSRRRKALDASVLQFGDLELDCLKRRAARGTHELLLTAREFTLLEYLMRHPNQVTNRALLAEHVWGHDFDTFSNVIDVHIARLRRKLDDGFSTKLLQTVRGCGYVLTAPEEK